jgi:flagella basal body P-ring formation protein FlgA
VVSRNARVVQYVRVTERAPLPQSPRPRRVATPSWLDVRLVLGVALVLASVLLGARLVSSARHTAPVVAARRDLAAGTVLSADDLTVVSARLPGVASGSYATGPAQLVGRRLSHAVSAGELVPVAAVDSVATHTTVTVPLEAAAAPDLRKGQRIELWVSVGNCAALVLLPDVAVQAVRTDSGAFGSGTGGQDVTISVAPALAERVVAALAIDDAQLRAGILTGSPSAEPSAELADLRACAAAR